MELLFLRHGLTCWNLEKVLQGQTDIPLAGEGIRQVSAWRITLEIDQWYVSPLARARQTADLLGISGYTVIPDLIEMNWGRWEGCKVEQLRDQAPEALAQNEARGLDLQPPDGETPRQVRTRLHDWLSTLTGHGRAGIVTHKGVIRAATSLATGWEMQQSPQISIRDNHGYLFRCKSGQLEFIREIRLS